MMKKRVLTALLIFITITASAQLNGDGSQADPYYGILTASATWDWENTGSGDGNIYIGSAAGDDLTISANGHLTILSGATIVFTQPSTDIIVTSTGRITADANPGDYITFTKSQGNAHRGHISFQAMGAAGPSLFDRCIFEYGNVRNLAGAAGYGGGIHADFSNLTIANSIFRYNIAEWGGGLFVNQNKNPLITRCIFLENESDNGGGGAYFWNGSYSVVTNSIFEGNRAGYGTATTFYTGGGVSLQSNTSVKLINCTFVNNDSNHPGDGLQIYGTAGSPAAINSLFWGSADQLAGSGISSRIINSAIQEYSEGVNTINLSASNSAADGPNFVAIDGSDWSVRFISPVRDAGTSSGAPANDITGNPRIGDPDIGAYEVIYSRWSGASGTDWSNQANWDGAMAPLTGNADVIIPSSLSAYPVNEGTAFTIGTNRHLIIEPSARATFDVLTNNGGWLVLRSDAAGIASLKFNSYTDNGNESISMFLTGGGGPDYRWHYVAVPTSVNKSVFTGINPYNLLLFDDSKIITDNMEGWQWHDGYDGTTGFTTLVPKRGYNFYHTEDVMVNFPSLSGLTGNMGSTVPLQFNGNGLNLIGNSLTCSINWDEVVLSGNMRQAVYFTSNNSMVSYVDGVGSPAGTTGIIPPLQGFFVKALETGCALDFSNPGVKTHGEVNRYKSETLKSLLRLELYTNNILNDETVVRLSYDASSSFDNNMDASKMFALSAPSATFWTRLEDENYVINSVPHPSEEFFIPVIINIKDEGIHSIKRTAIAALDNYLIELTDLYQSFTLNLQESSEYSFSSDAGLFDDRFLIRIVPRATVIAGTEDPATEINMFVRDNILNIEPSGDQWGSSKCQITVFDMTGRIIEKFPDRQLQRGSILQLPFARPSGLYIVEIKEGNKRSVSKIAKQ